MLLGAHVLIYSRDADADRAFLRTLLDGPAVDAGGGWLILGLPPAELAVHPAAEDESRAAETETMLDASLYLMCDDLDRTMRELGDRGARFSAIATERWGRRTAIVLPSGGALGLYQPTHPTALGS